MKDLAKQLREMLPNEPCGRWARLAADEIERLQAVVDRIAGGIAGVQGQQGNRVESIMRDRHQIAASPLAGDVVEDAETMFRVIAVAEEHVWLKQYGHGYRVVSAAWWKDEMESKPTLDVIRDGAADCPY